MESSSVGRKDRSAEGSRGGRWEGVSPSPEKFCSFASKSHVCGALYTRAGKNLGFLEFFLGF